MQTVFFVTVGHIDRLSLDHYCDFYFSTCKDIVPTMIGPIDIDTLIFKYRTHLLSFSLFFFLILFCTLSDPIRPSIHPSIPHCLIYSSLFSTVVMLFCLFVCHVTLCMYITYQMKVFFYSICILFTNK